jgi:predicted tellurium resistance membrane protein TerC
LLESLSHADIWISLLTLTAMEIVLGIDNIIFIAILVGRVPADQREKIRQAGIGIALLSRLVLLMGISWIMKLTDVLFTVGDLGVTGKHLILLGGGLFLIGKASHEMYEKLEGSEHSATTAGGAAVGASQAGAILAQIAVIDVVFSLDSVITAVGMADHLWVMVTAMLISVGVMLVSAKSIGDFVERHPSMKILALSFLLLIGVLLVAEGTGQHLSKGYVYFAMGFSMLVEGLNMRFRKIQAPVRLHDAPEERP